MLLHHRNLECTGRRSLVIDNRKCSTIRTGVIIQSKTTKLKNPYLRKRVQICAISEKPSAGKYCRLNRNPTEKHSVLKSWLSRYWSVRFEILSLRPSARCFTRCGRLKGGLLKSPNRFIHLAFMPLMHAGKTRQSRRSQPSPFRGYSMYTLTIYDAAEERPLPRVISAH